MLFEALESRTLASAAVPITAFDPTVAPDMVMSVGRSAASTKSHGNPHNDPAPPPPVAPPPLPPPGPVFVIYPAPTDLGTPITVPAGATLWGLNGGNSDDVQQGEYGTCYEEAAAMAMIDANAAKFKSCFQEMSNGDVAVLLANAGTGYKATWVEVTPEFSVHQERITSSLALWPLFLGKAWAETRVPGNPSFAAASNGWFTEVTQALGAGVWTTEGTSFAAFPTGDSFGTWLNQELATGHGVMVGTWPTTATLPASHGFELMGAVTIGGTVYVDAQNPWNFGDVEDPYPVYVNDCISQIVVVS